MSDFFSEIRNDINDDEELDRVANEIATIMSRFMRLNKLSRRMEGELVDCLYRFICDLGYQIDYYDEFGCMIMNTFYKIHDWTYSQAYCWYRPGSYSYRTDWTDW